LHTERSRIALLGLESAADLRRVVSKDFQPVMLPPDGLLLTTELAEILSVRPGQSVTVEVLEGARPVRDVVVAGTSMNWLGYPPTWTSAP
jgi:putative ABC transport system permease protein